MIKYIVLNILFSTTFAPTVPIVSDYDYEDSIIIQPISNIDDLPPALCLLPWPLNTDFGGK